MKQISIKLIDIIIISSILIQLMTPLSLINISYASTDEDIYDVILFWGQSNMVGYCGLYNTDALAQSHSSNNEAKPDPRYNYSNTSSVAAYSNKSGIDPIFLANSEKMNYVKIEQTPNTVYEYKYLDNKLNEITANTKTFGERLLYNSTTKKLQSASSPYSISYSFGTNMIPQFCKSYYEITGHKVVAVLAANSGEKIANFLPSTDSEYGDTNNQKIYEAMKEIYTSAINYMNSQNYHIDRKLWVCFQGENDVTITSTSEYKRLFLKVHNYLKNDMNITKGAIVETSTEIGTSLYQKVENIHNAQVQLAEENDDIVLGSSYAYDYYLPDKTTYNNSNYNNSIFIDANGQKLAYDDAKNKATSGMCYPGNTIHCTSAALCQIGKETATSLAESFDTIAPTLSVKYSSTNLTNKNVTVTISADEQLQEINGWTLSQDKKSLSKVYQTNKSEQITVYDIAGNSKTVDVSVTNIDKTSLVTNVSYSTTLPTNENVVVTISSNKQLQELEGWTLSQDKKSLSKVYQTNNSEQITVYDIAGNSKTVDVSVTNIDKTVPVTNVSYSTTLPTNENVVVTISSNKQLQEVEGWTLSQDKKSLSKVFTKNIVEEVLVYDISGNSQKIIINISNIVDLNRETEIETTEIETTETKKFELPNSLPDTGFESIIIIIIPLALFAYICYKKSK